MEYNFLEIILLLKIKIIKNNQKTLIDTNITKLDWCLLFDYKIYNHVLRAVDPEPHVSESRKEIFLNKNKK